jgi:hypothetical protein
MNGWMKIKKMKKKNPTNFIFHPSFNLAKSNKKKLSTSCHLRKWIINEGE